MPDKCFMIQPFDNDKFDARFDDVFAPAVIAAGLEPYRVDRDPGVSAPIEEIERNILEASACFVDLTTNNPNVWFELGYAVAARKDLCLVCGSERDGPFPFDIQHHKIIRYASNSPRDFKSLSKSITERLLALKKQQETRADIQSITREPETAGLADFEASCLACVGSIANGPDDTVSNWSLRNEMEKAGFNQLACNVALRQLSKKEMVSTRTQDGEDGPFECYLLTNKGWNWVVANTHVLDLRVKAKKKKSGGFDEIPF